MLEINALPGEMVSNFLNRVLEQAQKENVTLIATHNTTSINVYPESYIVDLYGKFDLTRELDSYKRCFEERK